MAVSGNSTIYNLIATGELESVVIFKRRMVRIESIRRLVAEGSKCPPPVRKVRAERPCPPDFHDISPPVGL